MSKNEPTDESKDINSLQESFNKQQKKISALKEMVRKSEVAHGKSTSTAQEKVRNIAQRLTHLKFKARSRQDSDDVSPTKQPQQQQDSVDLSQTQPTVEESTTQSSGSDKVNLLRQQMQQNKMLMAQRASSKQHLENLVTQLKEKFDSTQQYLEDTSELGKSMSDLSGHMHTPVSRERFKSATDLSTQSFSLEKERIKFLENRCRLLEKQLEKEKQLHLNQQEDNALSEAKERNKELQQKIYTLEQKTANADDLLINNERLQDELSMKSKRVHELEEALDVAETLQFDMKNKLEAATEKSAAPEVVEDEAVKAEMAKQIQQLSDELRELKTENEKLNERLVESEKLEVSDVNIAEKLAGYETQLESLRLEVEQERERFAKKEEELMEKTIELNVLNANFKVLEEKLEINKQNTQLFPQTSDETAATALSAEIQQLKQKLDDSNKAMIKMKLKCKQTEKQMDKLKKGTNLHEELVNLQQQIAELEAEKAQWQSNATATATTTTTTTTNDEELEKQCKTQQETIRLLELEKFEHIKQLEKLQQQVDTNKETDRVKSELSEIQWEEQLSEQEVRIQELLETLKQRDAELLELQEKLKETQASKEDLEKKVEHYLSENMELLDKIEKLNKSSSSAESIEIVERLTQQERAELAAYDKNLSTETHESRVTQTELAPDLSESLIKLREESSELMNKIELFTNERREVLDKMETLTAENSELVQKISELNEQREELETNALLAENAKSQLEAQLTHLNEEKQTLISEIEQCKKLDNNATKELSSLQQTSEIVAALDPKADATLFDKCEKSLAKLNTELEAYRRASDKGAKFHACKKLAKEAKNAHVQLSELLQKVKEASSAVETVTVVETVVAVTASDGSALVEYEQLNAQNRDLKKRLQELEMQLEDLREDAAFAKDTEMKAQMAEYVKKCETLNAEVEQLQLALMEARLQAEQRSSEVVNLQAELTQLRTLSDDFDRQINDKDVAFENKVEQLMRLRNQLQDKCETYEAEMEVLQTLVKEQKQQLIEAYKENEHEMNLKLLDLQQRDEEIKQLKQDLQEIRTRNEATGSDTAQQLAAECDKLKEALRINKNLVAEQIEELGNKQETIDALNAQITELYKTMEANVNEVIEKDDEILRLQQALDANTQQLERLQKDNVNQQSVVDKLLNELHTHRSSLPQLEADVARLEAEKQAVEKQNTELEQRHKEQVEKMKKYAVNLKKRTQQCQEYESKIKQLEASCQEQPAPQDLEEIHTLKQALQTKTMEHLEAMEQLNQVQQQLQTTQQNMEQQSREIVQLQNAFAAAQMADDQAMQLEQQKLQMKQIEDELELQQSENDQLRMELLLLREAERRERQAAEELREKLAAAPQELQKLQEELKNKTVKFEKSKAVIKEYKNQLQRLNLQIQELQGQLSNQPEEEHSEAYEQLKLDHEKLQAKFAEEQQNFQQTIERLETLHAGIEAKLQEDMSYIECLEQENCKYKEKVCRLEEAVAAYEERRASMERQVSLLDAQMQTRADEYERHEDELVYRLNMLSEHDEIIAQRLLKTHEQKESVQEQLTTLQEENANLSKQLKQLEKDYKSLESDLTANMEQTQEQLRQDLVEKHEEELQRLTKNYEGKLKAAQQQLEEQDNEQSEQLLQLQSERRALNEQLERARDEIVKLQEAQHALEQGKAELERESTWLRLQQENSQQDQLDLQELRMQSMQDKTELENLRHQIDTLINNHNLELQGLRAQISDLDNLGMQVGQNQTDDQVFIETENKRLTELLVEKQTLIEQLLQQMTYETSHSRDRIAELQRQLQDKTQELEAVLSRQDSTAVPASAIFFGNNESQSSPFDEIVQAREVRQLQAEPPAAIDTRTQSTIEDLQRNVCDLEKHAHELELKLANYKEQERSLQDALQQIQVLQEEKAQLQAKLQQQAVEEQIIVAAPPTLDMFFGQTAGAAEFEQLVAPPANRDDVDQPMPVVEEVIVPKKAYVCQPSSEEIALELGGDDWGDSWAGHEEPASATVAAGNTSLLSQEQQLNLQLQESQESYQELLKKYEELQLKSNKMLKKLKEYKQKLENTASHNDFDNMLDVAIQDELKAQIQKLEARLAEQQKLQESAAAEKDKLLQRIDVLEAGNERMSEMKERQDTDVYMYQTRIRELQQKLQEFEQPSQVSTVVEQPQQAVVPDAKVEQLQRELQDAYAEQQELQAVLDEERSNVQRIEATVKQLQLTNENISLELSSARSEYDNLKKQYNELSDELTKLQLTNENISLELSTTRSEYENLKKQYNEMSANQAEQQQQNQQVQDVQFELEKVQNEAKQVLNEQEELRRQLAVNEEQLAELQSELMSEREKNLELTQANQELSANVQEVEKLQKQLTERLTESATPNDELLMKLSEKDAEIMHLKQQTENLIREDQTEKLVLEILSKNQEIHLLKVQVKDLEDDKQELEHNLSMLANKESTANETEQSVKELTAKLQDLEQEKASMEEELRVLNDHVMQSLQLEDKMKAALLELDVKNAEISQLRNALANKNTTTTNMDAAHWENIIEQRCAEIAQMWRMHSEQREAEFKAVELQLQTQIESLRNAANQQQQQQQTQTHTQTRPPARGISTETTGTSTPASDTSSAPASETSSAAASKDNSPLHRHVLRAGTDDSPNILEKMQAALESQEMEIITLKEQLAIRSAEYARLAAQYDPFNSSNSPTAARTPNEANNATVAKSELDLALYMLHQRDMRCEEMTLELVRLLEERDTLQLKLSNTLRQVETMKSLSHVSSEATDVANLSIQSNSEQQEAASLEQSFELNQKLSELSTVNHSKDKIIKDEREERNRQMEKIQQDVAKLPPAAVSEFAGVDFSQGNESSSSLLLNWLWGNKPASTTGNSPNN